MKPTSLSPKVQATLQQAIALHNTGLPDNLAKADEMYRKVLQQAPGQPDALHLRALVAHARERFDDATRFAEAAIGAAPRIANFHNTAGEAWRRLGQLDKAVRRLQDAIRLEPGMAMAHRNLSLALADAGRLDEAWQAHRRALELGLPESPDVLVHALELASRREDDASAAALVERLQRLAGDAQAAEALARWHARRARARLNQGLPAEAEAAASAAIEAQRDFWGGWALRSEARFEQLRFDEAEHDAATAAELAPDNRDACMNLAIILNRQKRHGAAAERIEAWLATHPDDEAARFSLATNQLALGDWAAGFANYEARWAVSAPGARPASPPPWTGRPVPRLLLASEQGLGDAVQMLRFVPEVQQRAGGAVVLQVPPPLLRLARRTFGPAGIEVVESAAAGASFDATCPLMSLPHALGLASPGRFRGDAPYLAAEADATRRFRARLAAHPGRTLGLVWRGNVASHANRLRTLPEAALAPLLALPGWRAVSLQFGVENPTMAGRPLVDLSREIADFEDLAGAMAAVDVVVTLDTGPAHLAGALGRPTVTLLPWLHDWRWGVEGTRTPWYASMTLARQGRDGDWSAAMRTVLDTLAG